MKTYYLSFISSFLLSLLLTPAVKKLAFLAGYIIHPKDDRWHYNSTAGLGGIAIFLAFGLCYLFFIPLNITNLVVLTGGTIIFGLGFIDDLIYIRPYTKLIVQIIVASMLTFFGILFNVTPYPLINIPLTIFWVVGLINALNLLDNMDGLSSGIVVISALIMSMHSISAGSYEIAIMTIILAGAALGFLRYNFPPAKIFMGDSGSLFLGYMLAEVAILGTHTGVGGKEHASNLLITLMVPLFVLSVPIFDTVFVTLIRKFDNRPVSQGGRDHTSHRLVALGLSERMTILVFYFISALFGFIAVLKTQVNIIVFCVIGAICIIGLTIFGLFLGGIKIYSKQSDIDKIQNRENKNKTYITDFIYYKRRLLEILVDLGIIFVAYISAFLLRYDCKIDSSTMSFILASMPIVVAIKFLCFSLFGLYRGVWKYISLKDLRAIFKAVTLGCVVSSMVILWINGFNPIFSRTVFIIDWLVLMILISGVRILLRLFRDFFVALTETGRRVLIIGAGDAGELVLREIQRNRNLNYKAVGFLDDDKNKLGLRIHGIPVLGSNNEIVDIVEKYAVEEILVAMPSAPKERIKKLCKRCEENGIKFKSISSLVEI